MRSSRLRVGLQPVDNVEALVHRNAVDEQARDLLHAADFDEPLTVRLTLVMLCSSTSVRPLSSKYFSTRLQNGQVSNI